MLAMELQKGRYKHYKGNMYEVLMTAQHSETEDWMVVYRTLYGNQSVWVRPYDIFMEKVDVNGVIKPRFEKVNDEK